MSTLTNMLLKEAIILYLLYSPAAATLAPQQEITYSNCFEEVCQKHFIGKSISLILPKFNMKISDLFVTRLSKLYTVTIVDKNKNIQIVSSLNKPPNIIFFISNRLDLIQSMKYLKLAQIWNPLARVLVVVLRNELISAKQASLLNMSEIKKIFRIFMKERSIKVNLILFDEYNKLKIFAWFPFDNENECSKRVQIVHSLGECLSDGNTTTNSLIVKTKYSDLPIVPPTFNNCPLVITAVKMEPYTICNHQTKCDDGIEIRLFQSISKELHFNLKVNVVERVDGSVYNSLLRRESDLLIGGITPLVRVRNKRLTQTVTYYQDELTWCVPEAATLSLWLNIFRVFDHETWGYFAFTLFCSGTTLYYLYKFYHHQENWWYSTAAAFFLTAGVPIPIKPTHSIVRLYLAIFCTYGLLMTATFNSFFMSTITRPAKDTQISRKLDLINKSTVLYAESDIMSLYKSGDDELSTYFWRNFRSCTEINACLEKMLTSSNNIAVATSREHAMHSPLMQKSKIYCFEKSENIYVYPVAALAHEHFQLLEEINHQIRKAIQAGLIEKWERDCMLRKNSNIVTNDVYSFSFQHISGCIFALIIGLTLASIAFVFEWYFNYKQNKAQNTDPAMWRVCEKMWVTHERNAWSEIMRYLRWKKKN